MGRAKKPETVAKVVRMPKDIAEGMKELSIEEFRDFSAIVSLACMQYLERAGRI